MGKIIDTILEDIKPALLKITYDYNITYDDGTTEKLENCGNYSCDGIIIKIQLGMDKENHFVKSKVIPYHKVKYFDFTEHYENINNDPCDFLSNEGKKLELIMNLKKSGIEATSP